MSNRPGRGGRKGQTHTATPRLRSYDVPPASEVTVTRADGSSSTVPAQKPRAAKRPARRKGPLVCTACGYPIEEGARRRTERGRPAHAECPGPAETRSAPRRAVPPNDEDWPKVTCPRCQAGPGKLCVIRAEKGTRSATPHTERVQLVARVRAAAKRRPPIG
jgi:hypothetical protein